MWKGWMFVLRYCLKRLVQSFISLFIVISVVFLLLRLMPIDGFFPDGAWMKLSWDVKLATLQKLGLYGADGQPINPFIQLFNYLKGIVTSFQFGESTEMYKGKQVMDIIADKMPLSLAFGVSGALIGMLLGYILGVLMARFKDSILDTSGMVYVVLVHAIPVLVYYFIIQFFLTKWIGAPMIYRSGKFISYITPVVCLVIAPIANNALWIRRYMVDEANKDYVKLAYAKGLPSRTVMFKHILRNAVVPMVYSIPVTLLGALSGALFLERQFSIPGMGRLLVDAINKRDNNFVQALVIIYAALGIMGVFLGDLLAITVDPRITLLDKGGTR